MQTVVRVGDAPADGAILAAAGGVSEAIADVEMSVGANARRVATGEVLFQPGDPRRHYRVEEGAVFHYVRWLDGSHDLIEVAFPGDIIGLGNLSTHISTAQAMVDTVVTFVPDHEIDHLLDVDDRLPLLLASAGEREFAYMRDNTLNSGKRTPVERLANYLIAVADDNGASGDPVVADEITSGYVAEQLQMSLDTLTTALVGLERKGLVQSIEGGLKITDPAELEKVANAA